MILLVGCEKGGSGKSTLATNLSVYLAHEGVRFVLLDTDPQRTASKWAERRDEYRKEHPEIPKILCLEKRGQGVYEAIMQLEQDYGNVIIDAGGRDSVELRFAMTAADRMTSPLGASQFDLETLENLAMVVTSAKAMNPKLKSTVLISNRDMSRGQDEYLEATEALQDFPGFDLSKNYMSHLKIYRTAARDGLGVVETKHSQAKAEIQLIGQEVFDL